MYLDDQMFIVPRSSPNFGNAMLVAVLFCQANNFCFDEVVLDFLTTFVSMFCFVILNEFANHFSFFICQRFALNNKVNTFRLFYVSDYLAFAIVLCQ